MKSFLEAGQSLKHYKIKRKLGQGGMGQVYLAEDTKLGRLVAIKLLPEETTQDEIAKLRLLQEARAASALNHPNIVTIYSIDEENDVDFIVMEYVKGETLRAIIERQPLAVPQLLDIGARVADALAAAHSAGIIHRDIKSENILLTGNLQPKILDFGLAKTIEPLLAGGVDSGASTKFNLTGAGGIIGTIYYMSPEQTRGETLDARSDIFSLGCILYEAAVGKLPFTGRSLISIAQDIANAEPPSPSRIRPELPVELDIIIERALAKDKERRYNSASELAAALKSLRGVSSETFIAQNGNGAQISTATKQTPESFVGREAELKRLEELTLQMINGKGRVVFVTGESGIGKSSLIREFLHRSRNRFTNVFTLQGRSVEQYGTGEAYLPFLEAVGALLPTQHRDRIVGLLRTYAPTWCLQFPAAFVSSIALEKLQQETAGATKERMMREMGDMLAALSTHAPVILLLEDLHWADPSSIDLLRHLGQRISEHRVLIVGTYRPADLERSEHPLKNCKFELQTQKLSEEFALDSLGEAQIAGFLDSHFRPNNFPPELSALIYGKTEGHPLFATSLIQFLAENGDIGEVNERWTLKRPLNEIRIEVPENVRSLIRKKIEALDENDRRALQYATIEGDEFLSTVLAALLNADELDLEEQLAVVERVHGLIETVGEEELPDGGLATRYRFAHALYQNVLYADMVTKRRILLHRKAGEKLLEHYGKQSPRIAAQLAEHFERGRDFPRTIEYLAHAGDNAGRLFANAEAAAHYSRALKLSKEYEQADRAETLLALYHKRGKVNLALGKFQKAVDDFTEMLEAAKRTGSTAQESAALNALTMTLFYSHRLDEITARADEILQAAERAGSEALRIEAMQVLALKHLGDGELDKAKPMLDDIIKSARVLNHKSVLLSGLAWRGILHFFQTEYETAETMLLEAQSLAKELRDSFLLLESYFVLGMTRGNQGRMSEALETFAEGIEMSRRYEDQFWGPRMPNCIGWIYRELQDFDRAMEYDQKGLNIGRQANVLEAQANSLINLGINQTQMGDGGRTLEAFREVESIFERDAWFRWRYKIRLHAGKSEHSLAEGNLEKAEKHARQLLEAATHFEARKYIIVAHNLLSQTALARGDFAQAETELNAALEQLQMHPVPIVAWKVYANVGNLRLRTGDAASAKEAFARAADTINKIAEGVKEENQCSLFFNSPVVKNVLEKI